MEKRKVEKVTDLEMIKGLADDMCEGVRTLMSKVDGRKEA